MIAHQEEVQDILTSQEHMRQVLTASIHPWTNNTHEIPVTGGDKSTARLT